MGNKAQDSKRLTKMIVIIIAIVIIAFIGKTYYVPKSKKKLVNATGSTSKYKYEITVAIDSFPGYAILRSDEMKKNLASSGILLKFIDDGGNYNERIGKLKKRSVDLAVFTIDANIKASSKLGEFPGSMIMIIDESNGADAIVAYKNALPDIKSLNSPDAKLCFTPDSPSETLARIPVAHFALPKLSKKWWKHGDGAQKIYKLLKKTSSSEKTAFVIWEPYVLKALENPAVHILFDSSRTRGYIVDVLMANRKFLSEKPELISNIVSAYFSSLYYYTHKKNGMVDLVMKDAAAGGEPLTKSQAKTIVKKIRWKNTLENYAHFGILTNTLGLQHIEDMIRNITDVLIKTDALSDDPVDGNYSSLFYDSILKELHEKDFHPGKLSNQFGLQTSDNEKISNDLDLKELNESEWNELSIVGELKIEPIYFGRGNARISMQSKYEMNNLVMVLNSFPHYYLRLYGNTRKVGDAQANKKLSLDRANSAMEFLVNKGINKNRIKAERKNPNSRLKGASAQSVIFQFLQKGY